MINNIKELLETYPKGKGLTIQIDNDSTVVYDGNDQKIFTGDGQYDVFTLWSLLCPESECDWV